MRIFFILSSIAVIGLWFGGVFTEGDTRMMFWSVPAGYGAGVAFAIIADIVKGRLNDRI